MSQPKLALLSKPLAENPPRRLLLIQPGALGDSLLTLPVADQLAKALANPSIEILGHLDYIRLFTSHRAINATADIDTAGLHLLFAQKPAELPRAFASFLARFDAVVTWLGESDSSFVRNLSTAMAGPVICIDRGPPANYPRHVVDYWLRQLFKNPPPPQQCDSLLRLSRADLSANVQQLSSSLGWPLDQTGYIVFHPGAGSEQKTWAPACLAQLADRIRQESDYRVVYLLGPAESERFSSETIELLKGSGQVLAELDISQAAALISQARTFLGHDSGPTHLTAALSVPTVAIFGPTNPTHWQPLSLSAQIVCTTNQTLLCAEAISVNCVYRRLREIMDFD